MNIDELTSALTERVAQSDNPAEVLRAPEFRELYAQIPQQAPEERASFGQRVNAMKQAVEAAVEARKVELSSVDVCPLDITAPMDVNASAPKFLSAEQGTIHPLMAEMQKPA